jgi:glyoxylase-like metal-dependent hydrolase (beta-lactamase superfamily II)
MPEDRYEVFAIRYARVDRQRPDNFLAGDPHDGPMPLDYFVWVVRSSKRTVVVDTGFDSDMAVRRGREVLTPVGDGLKAIGVAPDAVDDVIVTHLHYDHAGNHNLFDSARFHLQDAEMAYATGRCMCHGLLRVPFELDDVLAMVRKVYDGRVVFHDGEVEIFPGISVHRVGGHSKGLQVVRVNTDRGWVVLASDASHFYEHIENGRAFPIVHNVEALLEGYRTVQRLAPSPDHIIPGHDPLVLTRYPPAGRGLDGIAARLDVAPVRADAAVRRDPAPA